MLNNEHYEFMNAVNLIPQVPPVETVPIDGRSAKAASFLAFLSEKISVAQAAKRRSVEVDRNSAEVKPYSVHGPELSAVTEALTSAGYTVDVKPVARTPGAPAMVAISW